MQSQIIAGGLVPIVEPEVDINSAEKEKCEEILGYLDDGDFNDYIERFEIDFNDSDVVDEFMSTIDQKYEIFRLRCTTLKMTYNGNSFILWLNVKGK